MKQHSDMHRKMRGRNIAMLVTILVFVILIAVVSYIKMGLGG